MKKKLLSILLMFTMLLSLTACGNNLGTMPTVKDFMESFSEIEANSTEGEMIIEYMGGEIGFKFDGGFQDESSMYMSILAKVNYDPIFMEDYYELTDMYIVDNEMVYINVQKIIDFVVRLDSQFAMLSTYFELPGEYLAYTQDDLVELYEELGMEYDVSIEGGVGASVTTSPEYNKKMLTFLGEFLDEYVEKTGGISTNVEKTKFTINVTSDNLETVLGGLAYMDLESYMSQLVSLVEEVQGSYAPGQIETLKSQYAGINEEMKYLAENYDMIKEQVVDFNFRLTMGTENGHGEVGMNFEVDDIKFDYVYTTSPELEQGFAIPANTMSMSEFIQMFYDYGLM